MVNTPSVALITPPARPLPGVAGPFLAGAVSTGLLSSIYEALRVHYGIYNVMEFGATGDGVSDDTSAWQATINACGEAGGGVVYAPPGIYRLATRSGAGGLFWALYVGYDNITIEGAGPATVIINACAENAVTFFAGGDMKAAVAAGDVTSWPMYQPFGFGNNSPDTFRPSTYLPNATIPEHATRVTFATGDDADNFAADDWIAIRTGQTVGGSEGDDTWQNQPAAEINRVKAKGVGYIDLYWPTKRTYAQEYFQGGLTYGPTTTSVTANLAKFGVSNITDRILLNFTVRNLKIVDTSGEFPFQGRTVYNMLFEYISFEGTVVGLNNPATWRNFTMRGCRSVTTAATTSGLWCFASDTGCSDGLLDDFIQETFGDYPITFHCNEDSADITFANFTLNNPEYAGDLHPLSVRSRGRRIKFVNGVVRGGSNTSLFYVDASVTGGGLIENVTFESLICAVAIAFEAGTTGWVVGAIPTTLDVVVPQPGNKLRDGLRSIDYTKLVAQSAGPSIAAIGSLGLQGWNFTTEGGSIGCFFHLPDEWKKFDVWIDWVRTGAESAANVVIGGQHTSLADGDAAGTGPDTIQNITVAAPTQNTIKKNRLMTNIVNTPFAGNLLNLYREADPFTGAIAIIGLTLYRVA